ncbi:MAG: hypothetical protein HUK28_02890 [Methanobrevibacter sp.]|nr:hypothetical protein [Methanobrevibacter sp.]
MRINELEGYKFDSLPIFDKEYDKILRKHKCPTLEEDFKRLQKTLVQNLKESEKFPKHICNRISGLDSNVCEPAFIVKNFRCKGIGGGSRSKFRITFVYFPEEGIIKFVEFFIKSKKNIENKQRINNMFK